MSPTVSGINAGFNGFEFARERRRLEGHLDASNVPLSAFERLRETGAEIEDLAYSIQGGTNDFGRPMLELGVRGRVRMQCQRCLEPVVVPIDAIVPLELRRTIEEIESAGDRLREVDPAGLEPDQRHAFANPTKVIGEFVTLMLGSMTTVARHEQFLKAICCMVTVENSQGNSNCHIAEGRVQVFIRLVAISRTHASSSFRIRMPSGVS